MRKLSFVVLASIVLASCKDAPSAPVLQSRSDIVPNIQNNSYIVVLKPGASAAAPAMRSMMAAVSTVDYTYTAAINGYAARMTPAAAANLQNDPNVLLVEPDMPVSLSGAGVQSPATWGLDRLDQVSLPLNNSYSYATSGAGVSVYILDTGIRPTHSEFGGRAVAAYSSITGGALDCHGHGTHVAGTIGGTTYGVAKNVNLYGVRVLDCTGNGMTSGVIAGINWVTANAVRPAVANMSLGGGISGALDAAVQGSVAAGITYAIAAGNSNANACNESPGRVPTAITVGATGSNDWRASFSNWGSCVDIFAPGVSITAAGFSSDVALATMSGTSMATPHVAGVAALYLEANPTHTPAQVTAGLLAAARTNKVQDPQGSPNLLLAVGASTPVNVAPTANFTVSCLVLVCTLNGSSSTDDQGVTSFAWSMPGALVSAAVGSTATATYLTSGSKSITLTVTDAAGLTNSKTVTVSVLAANQAPSATITAPAAGASIVQGSSVAFTGTGTDPEDGTLTGASLTWSSSINGAIGAGPAFSISTLSVGSHVITLTATDAQGLTGTTTRSITVTAPVTNQKPVPTILTPAVGFVAVVGTPVTFTGACSDAEDGTVPTSGFFWTIPVNGGSTLGQGSPLTTTKLPVGTYNVTLLCRDSNNQMVGTSRSITIVATNTLPTPVITAPTANASAVQNTSVAFQGSASDPEDVTVSASGLKWTSSINGQIGTGSAFSTASLSVGVHTITLTATDSHGGSKSVTSTLTIVAPNQAPVAAITSPATGTSVVQGSHITFTGTGTDPEQGALTGAALTWSSNIAGVIGTGTSLSTTALAVGTHTVTLTARDAQNASHSASISVTIVAPNQAPVAAITSPANGTSVVQGTSVTFTGTGTDPEQGALSGAALDWSSNVGGALGTGASVTTSALAVGVHVITLTVHDAQNASHSTSVTVTITAPTGNQKSVVTITSPVNGASQQVGTTWTFTGTAVDPEDGTLTGSRLIWTTNALGGKVLGYGNTINVSSLPVGTWKINLLGTDSKGLNGTAQRTITVTP